MSRRLEYKNCVIFTNIKREVKSSEYVMLTVLRGKCYSVLLCHMRSF